MGSVLGGPEKEGEQSLTGREKASRPHAHDAPGAPHAPSPGALRPLPRWAPQGIVQTTRLGPSDLPEVTDGHGDTYSGAHLP